MPMAMIYFTAGNREEALRIGRVLVEERLAACVNELGEITSIYRWDGAVQQEPEVAALSQSVSGLGRLCAGQRLLDEAEPKRKAKDG